MSRKVVDRSRTARISNSVKRTVLRPTRHKRKTVEFLNSGCAMNNLAASGDIKGGYPRGRIINIVGDKSTGKTLLALEFAAWCLYHVKRIKSNIYPDVKKIRIVYDNAEGVMDFDLDELFMSEFKDSIEWHQSETVESWGRNVGRVLKEIKPGIFTLYIIDSLDALPSEAAMKRFEKAAKDDKPEESKQYAEKASYLSQSFFSNLVSRMKDKDFTLVIISQVRERIGITFGEKYYRTGGKALDFYSHLVGWLAIKQRLQKTVSGQKIQYGVKVRMRYKKNKVYKPYREAEFDLLYDYGVDCLGSVIDYMGVPSGMKRDDYVYECQMDDDIKRELVRKAQKKWDRIEEEVKPKRVPKYQGRS